MIGRKCSLRIVVVVPMHPAMWMLASQEMCSCFARADVDDGAVVGV